MGIAVEGFGAQIASHKLAPGDLAICDLGAAGTFLVMRLDMDPPQRYDLFLAPLVKGSVPERAYPFIRPSQGDYIALQGRFAARSVGSIPIPSNTPGPGTLVIDPEGRPFIRIEDGGTIYVALDTFEEARPGQDRTYYPHWNLVLIDRDEDKVVVSFPVES